jgi:hypothetical protein
MRHMIPWCGLTVVVVLVSCACGASEPASAADEQPAVTWGDYSVEVNAHGNLGRIFLARGFDEIDAMRARVRATDVEPNVWKVALVLVPVFDVTWTDYAGGRQHTVATLTPEQMDNARASFEKTADWVYTFSGGNLVWDVSEFVFDEPVAIVMGPDQQGAFFPPTLKDEMIAAFPDWDPDAFDSSITVFPPGTMHLNAFGRSWGWWHGKLKAGNANIAYFAGQIGPDAGMVYVMLHEWLHQAESVMASNLGYFGLPGLHDLRENGYGRTDLELPSETCWYRDFMFRLFRPAMWQQADMNRKTWWRPAPRSDFVTQWLVRGPFPNEKKGGLDVDFLDGETDAVPVAAAETAFPIEDSAEWHVLDTAAQRERLPDDATDTQHQERADLEQIVDLAAAFMPNTDAVAYAHVYINAPRTEEALLWIGSDSGVKVFFNGLMVHRNRVDRGLTRDSDRVPVMLVKGWNRLLVKVDQGIDDWGFSARLSTLDGAPVPGLTTAVELPDGAVVVEGKPVPVAWDGTLYAWDEVKDDPWAKLPRLSDELLREITGLQDLKLEARTGMLRVDVGTSSPVVSQVLGRIEPADDRLNNQLTYRNESLAWIRYRARSRDERFESTRRDLLLVRWDLIEPWVGWIDSRSAVPAECSIAGYVVLERQLAYVLYTDLGEREPSRELDLVPVEDDGVRASVGLEQAESLTDKIVNARLRVTNTRGEAVTVRRIGAACEHAGVEAITRSPIDDERVGPGSELSRRVPLLRVAADAEPGVKRARVWLEVETPSGPTRLEKWVAVEVKRPVGIELVVDGPSIVKGGATRTAHLTLTNNAAHLGKVTWHVGGPGVRAKPRSERFTIRPLPAVTEQALTLGFGRARRMAVREVVATVDVADDTVPDSRRVVPVQVGPSKALVQHHFESDLEGWRVAAGTYSIEHVQGRDMGGRGYVRITDGGGDKYGRIMVFGPERGAGRAWRTAYSSDEYPMIEFSVALEQTGNVGVIIRADNKRYVLVLTGEFDVGHGVDDVLGDLDLSTDGTVHTVRFNLDEALDAVAGDGVHAVREIMIGDRREWSNREPGPDVGTIMIDDFTIR